MLSSSTDAFNDLSLTSFEQLFLDDCDLRDLDREKFLIRGAITRIGAFSNIGKSKIAYFLAHRLLRKGYKGIIFSSEVPRSIVLANMLVIETGASFWDILERRYTPTDFDKESLRNLSIYDVTQTGNSLAHFEKVLLAHIEGGNKPDFIVIDFVQGVMPSIRTDGEYDQMSKYALEVQMIAQKYNVCVIDLSQINNVGLRDEFESAGHIPFKGSGHLYSSADIGILLKRNKLTDDKFMKFEIRKHKYMPPRNITLECNFSKGTFKVFGDI